MVFTYESDELDNEATVNEETSAVYPVELFICNASTTSLTYYLVIFGGLSALNTNNFSKLLKTFRIL